MSFKKDMMDDIRDWEGRRVKNEGDRPFMEVWPDDGFAEWVSAHEDRVRNIICNTPEYRATPYCAVGYN
ncbi:MAG: hypothetical protein ACLP5H_28690 [Desulfomonilaceae bacterium]